MNAKEMDDCLHALGQTCAFFGKELDSLQVGFWRQFFSGKNPHRALTAIKAYAISGRYAPKPKDLLEEYQKLKDADTVERSYVTPALEAPKCPADVSLGWRYWLPRFYGNNVGGLMGKAGKVTEEQAEHLLFIVNKEAKAQGLIEAIPEAFRLEAVWGKPC